MSTAIEKYKATEIAALAINNFADVQEAISTNVGSTGMSAMDLPRITVPGGGGVQWAIQTLEGEQMTDTLVGVVVLARDVRSYWQRSLNEGDRTPPDCFSSNGITGVAITDQGPGGVCAACPLAKFGSDPKDQRGQACKQMKQLFILRPSNVLPDLLQVPPTSVKNARSYLTRLMAQGAPYYKVLTAVTLNRQKNPSGISYSEAEFHFVRMLTPAEQEAARNYHQMIRGLTELAPLDTQPADTSAGSFDGGEEDGKEPINLS